MPIPFTQRLSYKQTCLTVLVAFVLGLTLSLTQVAMDYASEDAIIDREVQSLLKVSHNPAARIAYNIDAELAQELLAGLLQSPAVLRATLTDNTGVELGRAGRALQNSPYREINDFLFGATRQFSDPLTLAGPPDEPLGTLWVEIDTYTFGISFLQRSLLTLITGFVRSLLLSAILLVLFYYTLTRPLASLSRALNQRQQWDSAEPLPYPTGHKHDEIGALVSSANAQLVKISHAISQRRSAEQQLNQHLAELEQSVSRRTLELQRANEQLKHSNQELEEARSQALHTARQRATFLASMSHEIRTPLSGLLGMLNLLEDRSLNSNQLEQLGLARKSGQLLLDLLNDALDLSKFEAGQLTLERIPFDLALLVEDCTCLLARNAQPGVEVSCLISPDLPATLLGDPTRIRQILNNLLSNALKFTPKGRIEVQLDWQQGEVQLAVCDSGIGMSQSTLQRVFEPFVQASPGIARQFGGSGLGLTLTRKLCQAMQGELSVSSEPNQGSRFVARLPLDSRRPAAALPALFGRVALYALSPGLQAQLQLWLPALGLTPYLIEQGQRLPEGCALSICDRAAHLDTLRASEDTPLLLVSRYESFISSERLSDLAPCRQISQPLTRHALFDALQRSLQPRPLAAHAAPAEALPQHSGHVLLVEDNPVNQLVAKGLLSKLGCTVSSVDHGQAALDWLATQRPDLILMDCNMPVMDGYETTLRIRENPNWADLPIIALTANALQDERAHCLALGMNDYLAKPFQREELQAALARWLPRAK